MIWKNSLNLDALNKICAIGAGGHMGITITAFDDNSLTATMAVDARTTQPFGLLHGGASVLLAETVASLAANLCIENDKVAVGLDINANHLRAVTEGFVTAVASPIHLGRTTQVWQIDISDDKNRAVCVSRLTVAVAVKNK